MKGLHVPVSTGLCLFLAALATFKATTQGLIPPLPANRLSAERGEFLQRASHQAIDWWPVGDAAFKQSRRLARPTLIVVGTPYSQTARDIDKQVFENDEVANLVNESFIAIRIDGVQKPRWLSAFLPLSRLKVGFMLGFQAFVVDTHGRLLSYIPPSTDDLDLDPTTFLSYLDASKDLFAKSELTDELTELTVAQRHDADQLDVGQGGPIASFSDFADALVGQRNESGGFTQGGVPRQLPKAWLYQCRIGRMDQLSRSLDPLLESPVVDILRGGFFGIRKSNGQSLVDFDQVTTRNAEMASMLAEANAVGPDELYDRLAHQTFDMLVRDLREQGLFDSCRQSDQGAKSRSASASFPSKRTADLFNSEESAWAAQYLGLQVRDNPQMVPHFTNKAVLNDPMLSEVLERLRSAHAPPTANAGDDTLDVNGHTVAELLKCGRLWGDVDRINTILDTSDALESFRTGADVVHLRGTANPGTYLGDYTGYSEAMLQDYLASGRSQAFENGLKVMERAMSLFKGSQEGEYLTEPDGNSDPLLPERINAPELADEATESCTAQIIQLLQDYGRLLPSGSEKSKLLEAASDASQRYSQVEMAMSPKLAGYYLSAASVIDPQCAITVGPNAQILADRLYRLRPARLIAAAFGAVRPDMQKRKPGIYVVNGSVIAGPYTVQEAAEVMPQALQVGVGS